MSHPAFCAISIRYLGLVTLIIVALLLKTYNYRDSNIGFVTVLAKNATCTERKGFFALKLNLLEKSEIEFSKTNFSSKDCEYIKYEISNNQTTVKFLKGNKLIIELSIGKDVIYEKRGSSVAVIFLAIFTWGLLLYFFSLFTNRQKHI